MNKVASSCLALACAAAVVGCLAALAAARLSESRDAADGDEQLFV